MERWVTVRQIDENLWVLDRPYNYRFEDGTVITVPRGYKTDFGTIPRILWWLTPRYGSYTSATVLHDYLITDMLDEVSPREVDEIFRAALKVLGVSGPRRWLMWAGVRWGALFNKKRREGSLGTILGVLLISVLALPIVLPALVLVPSMALFGLLERLWN